MAPIRSVYVACPAWMLTHQAAASAEGHCTIGAVPSMGRFGQDRQKNGKQSVIWSSNRQRDPRYYPGSNNQPVLGAEPNALLYQGPVWHSQCYWAKSLPQLSSWKMLANPGEYLSAFCAWFIIRRRRDPPQCRHMLQSLQFQKETSATTCATTFVHSAPVMFPHSRKKKSIPLIRLS